MEPPLCACGCGQTIRARRYPSQGQPRFLQGHQHKGANNGNYRGGKEQRTCPVCGASFWEHLSQVAVTCGQATCTSAWQSLVQRARGRTKLAAACATCGTKLWRYPSQVRGQSYCNLRCRGRAQTVGGNANHNWKGGTSKWQARQARLRDSDRCVVCGFDLVTDVHHVTPRHQGGADELSNLLTLCPNHHRLAHIGIISLEHLRRDEVTPSHAGPANR